MKLQHFQSDDGEERIYLDIQGSVHAYLYPREGGLPDWNVEIFDLENDPKKVQQLYRDIYQFVSEEFATTNMDEFRLIEWENLRSRAKVLEMEDPTHNQRAHSASLHGFMERCQHGKVPKKWKNARYNIERQNMEKQR